MNGAWIAVLVGAAVTGIAKLVMGGMIRQEAETRLGRIPYALIRLAAAQVARELRDELAAEWRAELDYVLTGTDGMPLTRLFRGIRYALGLLMSARAITDGLTRGDRMRAMRRVARLAYGADTLLLLYAFSGVTNVNWAKPFSAALAFAIQLAAMVTVLSVGFLRFAGIHLWRYKTDSGTIPLRGLDRFTVIVAGMALVPTAMIAALTFGPIHAVLLRELGPRADVTATIISLVVSLVVILANILILGVNALNGPGEIQLEPPDQGPDA